MSISHALRCSNCLLSLLQGLSRLEERSQRMDKVISLDRVGLKLSILIKTVNAIQKSANRKTEKETEKTGEEEDSVDCLASLLFRMKTSDNF